ncbi:Intracellular distribution of mitochondria, partial [Rhizoclosmatium hyalinum]
IYQRRALLIHERISGFDDPETLQQYLNLGFFECLTGNFSVGFDYMNHALKFFEMHCGTAVHPELAAADAQIAMLLAESKSDLPLGLKFLTRAIKTYEDVLGKEHDQTIRSYELYINQLIQLNDWERALEYQELVTASMKKRYTGDDEKSKNIVANAEKFVEFFKHKIQTEKAEKAGKAKAATEGAKKATPGSAKANKPKQAVPAVAKTIPAAVSKAPKGAATAANEVEPNKGHLSIDELMNFIDGSNGKKKGKKGKK